MARAAANAAHHAPAFQRLLRRKGASLERLLVLVALDEAGSLIRAAGGDATRASQFTRQLNELEGFLGCQLTRQQGRHRVLNPEGAHLAAATRAYFQTIESVRDRAQGAQPWTVVGAGESLLHWVVIPALARAAAAEGGPRFRFANLRNAAIVAGLLDHAVDFGLVRREAVVAPLQSVALGSVAYALHVPRRLARTLPAADWRSVLRHLPVAFHEEDTYVQAELDAALAALGIEPDVRLRFQSFPSGHTALAAGRLAVLMVRFPGLQNLPADVVEVPLPCLDHTSREIHLAWSPHALSVRPELEAARGALVAALRWMDR